ncbi:MAG: LysR family transcriptional regulator [Labrenzia sp.]
MIGSRVNDILIFMSVIDKNSFVAGGKAFGLTRSTAGKAVARLEDHYGTRLLNRTTRAISLTPEGEDLYRHGMQIRAAIEETETTLQNLAGAPRGTLRIAAPGAMGRKLLLSTVQRYLRDWPDIQIEISFSDRVENVVADNYDLALRIGVTEPDQGLIMRTLLIDRAVLCAAPSYFADRTRPQSIEQLGPLDLIHFGTHPERQGWHLSEEEGVWTRVSGRSRLRVDNASALRDAGLAGLGIVLLPRLLVEDELANGQLEPVLPNVSCGSIPILALYPQRKHLEPRVRKFLDLLFKDLDRFRQHRENPGLTEPPSVTSDPA